MHVDSLNVHLKKVHWLGSLQFPIMNMAFFLHKGHFRMHYAYGMVGGSQEYIVSAVVAPCSQLITL